MKSLLSVDQARTNDNYTMNTVGIGETELITRVAKSVLSVLQNGAYDLTHPCILCGSGNNGADGLALALMLKEQNYAVKVVYLGKLYADPTEQKPKKKNKKDAEPAIAPEMSGTPDVEAMSAQCRSLFTHVQNAGIEILTDALPEDATLYVDAIFGIGFHGTLDARTASMIQAVNASSTPVVSVDIPSGVNADNGQAAEAIYATETVTVQALKIGLQVYPGTEHTGKITVADVGIENDPAAADPQCSVLEQEDIAALMPPRPARSCKGTFGRVLVVCGSVGMAGAAYLAASGAFRMGAGLVEIFTPMKNRVVLQQLIPEAIITCYSSNSKKDMVKSLKYAIGRADAVVLGCGLGRSKQAKKIVATVLKKTRVPLVIDADALNIIARKPALLKKIKKEQKMQTVITPHAAEAARLLGKSTKVDAVLECTYASAEQLHQKFGINVLLKDTHSVIYATDGAHYVNTSGSTALATAGSGDILAGMIGGLAASQTNQNPISKTAALAAYLHGKAGEKAAENVGEHAAMARDILEGLKKS
ncbi:MAG: NAD(P)H-hydrate dehydratase [Clostridia bacterium]|nr:NAD(P)H-hydrate dehydratase [Clostridia bacterium]